MSVVQPPVLSSVREDVRQACSGLVIFKASKDGVCTASLGILSYPNAFQNREGIQKMS